LWGGGGGAGGVGWVFGGGLDIRVAERKSPLVRRGEHQITELWRKAVGESSFIRKIHTGGKHCPVLDSHCRKADVAGGIRGAVCFKVQENTVNWGNSQQRKKGLFAVFVGRNAKCRTSWEEELKETSRLRGVVNRYRPLLSD